MLNVVDFSNANFERIYPIMQLQSTYDMYMDIRNSRCAKEWRLIMCNVHPILDNKFTSSQLFSDIHVVYKVHAIQECTSFYFSRHKSMPKLNLNLHKRRSNSQRLSYISNVNLCSILAHICYEENVNKWIAACHDRL